MPSRFSCLMAAILPCAARRSRPPAAPRESAWGTARVPATCRAGPARYVVRMADSSPAVLSGVFALGGSLPVTRLGFGAMRITGPGIWGEPRDRTTAIQVLRRGVELGVDFIDTAESYGPFVSEELIAEALCPYDGIAIATKGGLVRTGPDEWHAVGRPEYLRQCVEMSLRRLRLEAIGLYQLHRIGLSQVSVAEIVEARLSAPIVSVQNVYNLVNRESEDVLDYCEREGLGFI